MRCIALLSGGLDSSLAVRLMQEQQIAVAAVRFTTPFAFRGDEAGAAADSLGVSLTIVDFSAAYGDFLRRPRFGYAAGAAPCLDCRITMLTKARELMESTKAEFVATGEVVGQRVKTSVRDLEIVAHHAGLEGRLLRPLSAGLLPPTEPEARGGVDRSRLLAIQGKSRREQIRLAEQLGVAPTPPRPDCPLLSEPLASRTLELVRSRLPLSPWLLPLLTASRHVLLDEQTCVLIGRNHEENTRLAAAADQLDCRPLALLEPDGFAGPVALLMGDLNESNVRHATALVARYSRKLPAESRMIVRSGGDVRYLPIEHSNHGAND